MLLVCWRTHINTKFTGKVAKRKENAYLEFYQCQATFSLMLIHSLSSGYIIIEVVLDWSTMLTQQNRNKIICLPTSYTEIYKCSSYGRLLGQYALFHKYITRFILVYFEFFNIKFDQGRAVHLNYCILSRPFLNIRVISYQLFLFRWLAVVLDGLMWCFLLLVEWG